MAMGRNLRVLHNGLPGHQQQPQQPQRPYSLVLEHRTKGEVLLVENYAIVALGERVFFFLVKEGKAVTRHETRGQLTN